MSTYMDDARKLRPLIEKAAQSLSDAEALQAVTLYPRWEELVELGTGEADGGTIVLVYLPHELIGKYFAEAL